MKLVGKVIRWLLLAAIAGILTFSFLLAAVMGNPDRQQSKAKTEETQLTGRESVSCESTEKLPDLLEGFPAPMLCFLSGGDMEFVSGTATDLAMDDGTARSITLNYRTGDGEAVTVRSVYPASAISLLKVDDYTLSSATAQSIAGMSAVRMDKENTIRFHALSEEALYVVELPAMEESKITQTLKTLQLASVRQEEEQ